MGNELKYYQHIGNGRYYSITETFFHTVIHSFIKHPSYTGIVFVEVGDKCAFHIRRKGTKGTVNRLRR